MKNYFQKIKTLALEYKKTSIVLGLVIIFIGYQIFSGLTSTSGETSYFLGTVTKGTVVSSITGSGQVASNRALDLKPKATGDVVYVAVAEGQKVSAGDLIVELDATDALKSVRDAKANLESAQIALQKIQAPADNVTLLQAQNNYTQAQNDLNKAYDDAFTNVSNSFLDMPNALTGLNGLLYGSDFSTGQWNLSFYKDTASQYETQATMGKAANYMNDADQKYRAAKTSYDQAFSDFKLLNRSSDPAQIQKILDESYTTNQLISDSLQSFENLVQYYQTELTNANLTANAKSNTHLTTASGFTSKINADLAALLSSKNAISTGVINVPQSKASLDKVQNGADPLDLQSAQLSVTQKENALQDAQDNLSNYYVRAPFNGTLSKLDVHRGDPASSGTAVATLIANDQVVDISLNEVDAASVIVGDKVTLTFDAIEGLTLTGKVSNIDTVGTVTQGVVNYTATISFDATDPRVKPGMSTTASIITKIDADVLTVPSSAIKTTANGSYVQAFDVDPTVTSTTTGGLISATPPTQIPVTVGISDDSNTEITQGVTEGQSIVIKVIAPATAAKTTTAASLLGNTGGRTGGAGGGAGGATRSATTRTN